ncbi:glycosyltransferase family 4 protein [Chloroflexota bacterium]
MLPEEIRREAVFLGNSTGIVSAVLDGLNFTLRNKLNKMFSVDKFDHVYMYNIHPFLNYYIARLSKRYNISFIQHVHEPYVEDKKLYKGIHQYWLFLFEYVQERLLGATDTAVLSSNEALSLFQRRYPKYSGRLVRIPLMYEDLGADLRDTENRKYITFVGPPVPAKGPKVFLEIAKYSEKHDLCLEFLLITHSKITNPKYYNLDNVKIYYKERIADEEIRDLLHQSLMTITPYETARQSSVVPTSYMCGTPVISTNVGGLPEVISHLKTGYLLDRDSKVEEWIEGIRLIKDNFPDMSRNCRSYFVENCSGANWPRYFPDILDKNMVKGEIRE